MNKEKINSKIEDLKAELQNLEKLANEPEQRTPAEGDVWQGEYDSYLIGEKESISLGVGHYLGGCGIEPSDFSVDAYLGKFNEVYVKISDVRAALSHKDVWGDSILASASDAKGISMGGITTQRTRKALRKLNIITY